MLGLSADPDVKNFLEGNSNWVKYVSNVLIPENEKNEMALGGKKSINENTMIEENLVFESNLQEVFQKLRDLKFDDEEEIREVQSSQNNDTDIECYDSEYWKEVEEFYSNSN